MSPILVRPVREQLEHDRVIRLLLARLKSRGEVVANIGDSQTVPVRVGQVQVYPDLVVTTTDKGHRVIETVEVETAESVNHLEAMAQWAHLGRGRAPFHLYVPAGSVEIARRLAAENHVNVAELWSFHSLGDQTRFTMVHRSPAELKRAAAELRRVTAQSERDAAAPPPEPVVLVAPDPVPTLALEPAPPPPAVAVRAKAKAGAPARRTATAPKSRAAAKSARPAPAKSARSRKTR